MEPKAQCKLELRGAFSGVLRVYKPYLSFSDGLWLWQKKAWLEEKKIHVYQMKLIKT